MSLDSFMNKTYSLINILSFALGGSIKGRRQYILSLDDEKVILPVTPIEYNNKSSQDNKIVNIIDTGEVMLFGNPILERLTFSSFFPSPKHEYPFIVTDDLKEPVEYVELFKKWKESKKPIRVIITDSPINKMMGLKSFNIKEKDGTKDIYYSMEFIEYKDLNTPMANNDKEINNVTGLKERASIKNTPDTITILDDVNDILDASKKAYGDYRHWRNIVESNNLTDFAINNIRKLNLKDL